MWKTRPPNSRQCHRPMTRIIASGWTLSLLSFSDPTGQDLVCLSHTGSSRENIWSEWKSAKFTSTRCICLPRETGGARLGVVHADLQLSFPPFFFSAFISVRILSAICHRATFQHRDHIRGLVRCTWRVGNAIRWCFYDFRLNTAISCFRANFKNCCAYR